MPTITFTSQNGESTTIDDAEGDLMSLAVKHGVQGIEGDCGGVCSCGTCHVQVDPAWIDKTGPATDEEREVLDFEQSATANSRLCCQIEMSPELDGLVVRVVRS
ncbi:2Fe-2S iron-sulfur cluster-binding protein [Botrimarina hoheduenensis]|uniref:Ferredoxin-6 n=1 Tax=Botrimarina hoheduenensis TaxID=2528000 RepID=A0A5C5VQ00_9BACT|nr:2Fe-2S iron-sulfur cluster-binding protein [Botrimarina hoheduenensis]TWT40686.1 Ferredoxin-6 [Botrimarina hoheduenensis]